MTAIEWFTKELLERGKIKESDIDLDIFNQAKELEKHQIFHARSDGFEISEEGWNGEYGVSDFDYLDDEIKNEEYYNKLYTTKEHSLTCE